MARLKDKYRAEVAPALKEHFGYKNVMEIPKLDKIVIGICLLLAIVAIVYVVLTNNGMIG